MKEVHSLEDAPVQCEDQHLKFSIQLGQHGRGEILFPKVKSVKYKRYERKEVKYVCGYNLKVRRAN